MKIYLNGKFVSRKDAVVSVFDHGLLYGDGAFEGIRSYRSLVFKLDEHINRLYETAHTLMIKVPLIKKQMIKAVTDTLKENNLKDAYIRVIVTRGEGDLGLNQILVADHAVDRLFDSACRVGIFEFDPDPGGNIIF